MAEIYNSIPVIALRGIVVFPNMNLHFEIGREKSVKAVEAAMENGQEVMLLTQKKIRTEDPSLDDLYEIGVIAKIDQIIKIKGKNIIRICVKGLSRAKTIGKCENENYLAADVVAVSDENDPDSDQIYIKGLIHSLKECYEEFIALSNKVAKDVLVSVIECDDLALLTDTIAGNAIENFRERQELLEELNPAFRAQKLLVILRELIEILAVKEEIDRKVQEKIDKSQKEYFLREEMHVIAAELNEDGEKDENEYKERVFLMQLPTKVEDKLLKECDKLGKMQSLSAEANVIRGYLDACLELPWNKFTEENDDIEKAKKILEKDHYGLEKVKERFIELLCVQKLGANPNSQIICLIGPPGVGKTSIAQSVAKAMGRNFSRISLGGVNDEAEIRGHRKTYIGSMPGRIINAVTQAQSSNPLILLDEIDKLGGSYKGDPAAALLEVLDGEQNHNFVDHFIEVPFDLSKTLFVTTANDASSIPLALYDRMEIIEIGSYTFEEKVNIATKHLVKKQMKVHGLTTKNFKMNKSAIKCIIENYTREAGVRLLEKNIATVCRKAAVKIVDGAEKVIVNGKDIEEYLSAPKYREKSLNEDRVGVVNGLAWTAVGGEMLEVEAAVLDGTGKIEITGNLGDVMTESAKLAVSVIRSVGKEYGLENDFYKTKDIHIHVPQGAVPKDGPSAGVTLSTALLSALSGKKVRGDVAMTGEISLTGRVMPIGGLKEKSMAAYKNHIKTVIIPKENESDLNEVASVVKENVEFIPVERLSQVFSIALRED